MKNLQQIKTVNAELTSKKVQDQEKSPHLWVVEEQELTMVHCSVFISGCGGGIYI